LFFGFIKEFKLKDSVYITEFEMVNSDDGFICIAACLSDGAPIYISTDQSNVKLKINKIELKKNLISIYKKGFQRPYY